MINPGSVRFTCSHSTVLKHFPTYVTNQYHKSVKTIRTDNRSEFLNSNCLTLFHDTGVKHQRTQQNGVVERKYKHLLQVARSILFQAKFPSKFWSETLLSATHIINRQPAKVSTGKALLKFFMVILQT